MHKKLKSILLNNWVQAGIVALIVILAFFPINNKYSAKLVKSELVTKERILYYDDLDFNGVSERIILEINQKGNTCFKIYNPKLLGQVNSNTKLPQMYSYILTDDTNSDGFKEIYFLGLRNDSVFVNQIDFYTLTNPKEYFIEKINKNSDAKIDLYFTSDLDNDKNKELIISINGGFSLQPRKIYSLNLTNDNVLKTPLLGSVLFPGVIEDIDNNNNQEIITGTYAYKNYGQNNKIPYSDNFSWVIVFNHNLNYKFTPIKISGKKTDTKVQTFQIKNDTYILACQNIKNDLSPYIKYSIINKKGNVIHTDSIYEKKPNNVDFYPILIPQSGKVDLLSPNGICYRINNKYKFDKIWIKPQLTGSHMLTRIDIDGDQNKETILNTFNTNEYFIADSKFKHFTKIKIPSVYYGDENITVNQISKGETQLVIQKKNEVFYISYKPNLFWKIRFLIWLGIYIAIYLVFSLFRYIQTISIKEKIQVQQQIRELQFKTITTQLNPHFTFNVLNTIANSVYNAQKPEVYDHFVSFSKLIREILTDSGNITRELDKEISFTKTFLELQKYRFKDAFDFNINIEKNVNTKIPVPKLIIQIFAENSIKHAFPFHQGEDKIEILVGQDKEYIIIKIIDNGKGFSKAKQSSSTTNSTGRGINIIKEYIRILNTGNSRHIKIDISETNKEDKTGTTVAVKTPLRYTYSLDL